MSSIINYPNFQEMSLRQLREYAKSKGCKGYSGLDRDQLWNKLWRFILTNDGVDIREIQQTNQP